MLAKQLKIAVVNNPCPKAYQSYGEMWIDGFRDAGCTVDVWAYQNISLIPARYDMYFFMDVRYDPATIPWYLGPRVVHTFDAHGTGAAYWAAQAAHFDYVALSSLPEVQQLAAEGFKNVLYLPEAANPRIHHATTLPHDRPHEIGYIGNPNGSLLRNGYTKDEMRRAMKEASPTAFDLKLDHGNEAEAFGTDYRDLLNSMRLCLDWPVSHNIGSRVFEASAAGCAVLRPDHNDGSGISEVLRPWEHYIPYDPTPQGLSLRLEQLRADGYRLSDAVAARAQKLVLRDHTYAVRAKRLLDTVLGDAGYFSLGGLMVEKY
jgi:hypothetical protein